MNTIRAEGLTRKFNGKAAVQEVSFTVEAGEIFGFLGRNGAGKTTTIRLLTGQLRPTAGRAWVAGYEVGRDDDLKQHIGVVFEYQNIYERMSGRENLAFFARLYQVDGLSVERVLEQVGLNERAGDRMKNYSNGMKQRLLIARALLHQPEVLFLDEPTRGLDPHIAQELRGLVRHLAGSGVTIFLTTHYMEEADQLCDRVAFIDEGRIVAMDTPERLKLIYGERTVRARMSDGSQTTFAIGEPDEGQRLGELVGSGHLVSLHSGEASLEDVFIQLTGRRIEP